ncbi:MAG TPA: hypothetical protein VNZ54_00660 [bacterium]|nr:hypothetical protein [bacterium]
MKLYGMGRGTALALLGACLAGPGAARAARIGVDPGRFSMAYLRSDQTSSIWAAGIEQILRYDGLAVRQEAIAKHIYGNGIDGTTNSGNHASDGEAIDKTFKDWKEGAVDEAGRHFKAAAIYWAGFPTPRVLQAELAAGRPILAFLKYPEDKLYLSGSAMITPGDVVIIEAGDCVPEPDGTPKFNSIEVRDPQVTWKDPKNAGFVTLTPLEFKKRILAYWTIQVSR